MDSIELKKIVEEPFLIVLHNLPSFIDSTSSFYHETKNHIKKGPKCFFTTVFYKSSYVRSQFTLNKVDQNGAFPVFLIQSYIILIKFIIIIFILYN